MKRPSNAKPVLQNTVCSRSRLAVLQSTLVDWSTRASTFPLMGSLCSASCDATVARSMLNFGTHRREASEHLCTDDAAFVWCATTVGATEHSAQHGTEFAEDM